MNLIKDIFYLMFALLAGYILFKLYQVVSTASGAIGGAAGNIGAGATSIADDAASAFNAISNLATNPLGSIFGGSSDSTPNISAPTGNANFDAFIAASDPNSLANFANQNSGALPINYP